jgi:hypothetical protein
VVRKKITEECFEEVSKRIQWEATINIAKE